MILGNQINGGSIAPVRRLLTRSGKRRCPLRTLDFRLRDSMLSHRARSRKLLP